MRRHTTAFRIAGAVAAMVALYSIPGLTFWWFLTIVVVLAAYEVSWIYVAPVDEADDPTEPATDTRPSPTR